MRPRSTFRRVGAWPLAVVPVLMSCAGEGAKEDETADIGAITEGLMEADRAFNRATAERGADGWVAFFADDGAMIAQGVGEIRGQPAIRAAMVPYFESGARLTWEPLRADASADGTLGYTVGEYRSERAGPDGEPSISRGLYVSLWRKQPDGAWRVVMDLGNPVDPPREEG